MSPAVRHAVVFVRISVLLATAVCAVIWALAVWWPEIGTAAGEALRARWTARVVERYRVATEPVEPGARLAALVAWSDELRPVRKLDGLAPAVRLVEPDLVARASAAGERGLALRHAARLVEFDERDVAALARWGELLVAEEPGRAVAILTDAWERARWFPATVGPLVAALVEHGESERAARVLCRTAAAQPGDVWHIRWSRAVPDETWFVFRSLEDGTVEARLVVDAPISDLRVSLPPFRAFALRDAELRIADGDDVVVTAFVDPTVSVTGLERQGELLVADGRAVAELGFGAVRAARPGCALTLRARIEPRQSRAVRDAVLGAHGGRIAAAPFLPADLARAIAALRARACLESGFALRGAELGVADAPADPRGAVQFDAAPEPGAGPLVAIFPPALRAIFGTVEVVPGAAAGSGSDALTIAVRAELPIPAPSGAGLRLRLVPR